jgi:D-sedoheptulose 7-phosphate isomerase
MTESIRTIFEDHQSVFDKMTRDKTLHEKMIQIAGKCVEAFSNEGKILFCGNGGSAADAQHIAAELSGKFNRDREPLFAEALHVNTSYLTAVANDYGFEHAYSRLIRAKARKGDILFGLSTSGNSANVVEAFLQARKQEVLTIGFTGMDGGKLANLSDILLKIPSVDTPRIQEMHILLGHIICELVEKALFE